MTNKFLLFDDYSDDKYVEEILPFARSMYISDGIVAFDHILLAESGGVQEDQKYLKAFPEMECSYGAGDCLMFPFVAELSSLSSDVTAQSVLDAIHIKSFRSQHIFELERTFIESSGYQPGSVNDEIHNEAKKQKMFERELNEFDEDLQDYDDEPMLFGSFKDHQLLKKGVVDEKLWYILLHCWMDDDTRYLQGKERYVVLFALGESKLSGNLIGFITYQMCHNLCD